METKLSVEYVLRVNEEHKNTILDISIRNLDLRNEEQVASVITSIQENFEFYKDNKSIQHIKSNANETNSLLSKDNQ